MFETFRMMRKCCFPILIAAFTGATAVQQAAGQLTEKDIESLKEQGRQEGWTFDVGYSEATEYTIGELCGLVEPEDWWQTAPIAPPPEKPLGELPAAFDWRDYDGCTPIRNQGGCGSCWAFSTVGAMECAIKIMDGIDTDLSEQWLVSCNQSGWSCNGGWFAHDYHRAKYDPCGGGGAVMESDFPYTARDDACRCPYPHEYYITSWQTLGMGVPSADVIKQAILDHGPVSCAVYVSSAFQGYRNGIFNACPSGPVNHAVVLVGWDDTQGTNGVWIMRNSWGEGWGEGGYMRIEYGCSSIGYSANYIVYPGKPTVSFDYPDGRPDGVSPDGTTMLSVQVQPGLDTPIPGTGTLHWCADGDWASAPMTDLGNNLYEVAFPAYACGQPCEYYVTTETQRGLVVSDPFLPEGWPAYNTVAANGNVELMADDFQTNQGWQVVNESVSKGAWVRAVPNQGGYRSDPLSDYDGSGFCYLTGAGANEDVNGGPTRLVSPVFDLDGRDAYIRFARWFVTMGGGTQDTLDVELSPNGNHWVRVAKLSTVRGWVEHQIRVRDYFQPTHSVQIRFSIADPDNDSISEAAIDAFSVVYADCDQLVLHADPIFRGQNTSLTATDCTPGQPVSFYFSLRGEGSTYVPELNVYLDMTAPILIGKRTANANGTAVLEALVPQYAPPQLLWLQSAESGRTSNTVLTQIN